MLEIAGHGMVLDQRPESMLAGFAITARATGRDILARLASSGRSISEIAVTDLAIIEHVSRHHAGFDSTGNPNLFLQDDISMLSVVKALTRRGRPLVIERVSLHSRIPWRVGRVFGFVRNPLPG